jgi:hypothetical protein
VGRLPSAGADRTTRGGVAMRGGAAVAAGSADKTVESPQCGHKIVSPTDVGKNSRCPLHDWHDPLRNFFSSVAGFSLIGWPGDAGIGLPVAAVAWTAPCGLEGRMIGGTGDGGIGIAFSLPKVPGMASGEGLKRSSEVGLLTSGIPRVGTGGGGTLRRLSSRWS